MNWSYSGLLTLAIFSVLFIFVPTIIASIYTSKYQNETCDKDILLWLFITEIIIGVSSAIFIFIFFKMLFTISKQKRGLMDEINQNFWFKEKRMIIENETPTIVVLSLKALKMIFFFFCVWFILGNFWFFGSSNCKNDAPNLYKLTKVVILVLWSFPGIYCTYQCIFQCFHFCCEEIY
ncbi:c3h4 type zinc finger protein [Anaeramoeba ignava]|uniref:C3h4 type zinc finger protein n=1 Tax=Anaeramoeba ignava TaxID=1746090 RepID=A0A9Q0LQ53_ANAIG|nr:c3h4 type zinc finger protein [Anaeramoeba ignava]